MKTKHLLIIILLPFSFSIFSQIDELDIKVPESEFDSKKDFITYYLAHQKPKFDNCKEINDEELKKCFDKNLKQHISKNLVYPEKYIKDSIKIRVSVIFKISRSGNVFDVKTHMSKIKNGKSIKTEDKKLFTQEVIRVIKSIPRLNPAEYYGEKVIVNYATNVYFSP